MHDHIIRSLGAASNYETKLHGGGFINVGINKHWKTYSQKGFVLYRQQAAGEFCERIVLAGYRAVVPFEGNIPRPLPQKAKYAPSALVRAWGEDSWTVCYNPWAES